VRFFARPFVCSLECGLEFGEQIHRDFASLDRLGHAVERLGLKVLQRFCLVIGHAGDPPAAE
jgi:hypothetical protein